MISGGSAMKKDVRLYNVLFPAWFLMLIPTVWLIVLPGNFLIDSLVLVAAMFALKVGEKKQFYKKHILKIFLFGLLADAIGSVFLFVMAFVLEMGVYGDEWYMTVPAVLISAAFVFLFNYGVTFKRCERPVRSRLALTFAIVTAPYTFLIPSAWLYGF